jgi:hypothetical protein
MVLKYNTKAIHQVSKVALRSAGCADILSSLGQYHFPFIAFGILVALTILAFLEIIYDQ